MTKPPSQPDQSAQHQPTQSRSNRHKVNMSVSKKSGDNNIPQPRVPRSNKIKWKDRDMIPLWMSYKNHPILWNDKLPGFRNKALRQAAFAEIAKSIPNKPFLTAANVEYRMKCLRSIYDKERSYILAKEEFGLEAKRKYFDYSWYALADEFLRPFTETTKKGIGVALQKDSDSDDDNENKQATEVTTEATEVKTEATEESNPQDEYKHLAAKKNEEEDQEDQYPVQFIHHVTKRYQKKIQQRERDEFDFFGKAIAIQLKKMPLPEALSLHQELMAMKNKAIARSVNMQPVVELTRMNITDTQIKLKMEPVETESENTLMTIADTQIKLKMEPVETESENTLLTEMNCRCTVVVKTEEDGDTILGK